MQKKHSGAIGIIITIVLLTVLVIITNIDTSNFSFLEGIAQKLVMPVQNGLTYLKNKIAGNNTFFEDINNLKTENESLKKQNEELNKSLSELGIIKAENKTLREYANLSDEYTKYTTVPAYIIDRDWGNLNSTIIINVGKREGVESNMPVVSADGEVPLERMKGDVIRLVYLAVHVAAKVQPIIDPSSSISGIMSISRDNLIVKGELGKSNELKATYISADADLVLNDDVETSGIGGIYPKGLKIGKLIEIVEAENVTEKYAIIKPAVDFSKIETVLVIIK